LLLHGKFRVVRRANLFFVTPFSQRVPPSALETPEDAGRALGAYGRGWELAIELGVDVTLLEHNLELSPAARIRLADEHAAACGEIQSRTVPAHVRTALERQRLAEKAVALEALTGE
jgi:hypothetical protein